MLVMVHIAEHSYLGTLDVSGENWIQQVIK